VCRTGGSQGAEYVGTDVDWVEQESRLTVACLADSATLAAFEAHRPTAGMACAEIGAGPGTIARWLCREVGPEGRVVATDLETKWLHLLDEPNLQVRRADIATDALGDREFDLVHVRAVLNHTDAVAALANVATALRPGGWLLVEEPDYGTAHLVYPPVEVWERFWAALASLTAGSGGDAYVAASSRTCCTPSGSSRTTCGKFRRVMNDSNPAAIRTVRPLYMSTGLRAQIFTCWDALEWGEAMRSIARRIGRARASVRTYIVAAQGRRPRLPGSSELRLSLTEREEISRGLSAGLSLRVIAAGLGRAPSTVCREVNANGGRRSYRAVRAEREAHRRARRPKRAKLATCRRLRRAVEAKLKEWWSPQQISAWLAEAYPDDPETRVSHETIYVSLYYRAGGRCAKSSTRACAPGGRCAGRRPAPRAASARARSPTR
jgi:hypothetical protein